jgi:hypothetical protein
VWQSIFSKPGLFGAFWGTLKDRSRLFALLMKKTGPGISAGPEPF